MMKKIIQILSFNLLLLLSANTFAQDITLIKDIDPVGHSYPRALKVINNKLYFNASDGVNGREMWVTDGTTNGTTMFMDINPGAASSNATGFTEFNGKIFFSADDGINGSELWSSDGTVGGTAMFKDLIPGNQYSSPSVLTPFNGKLFFVVQETVFNAELWVSDGTEAGTELFKRFNLSNSSSVSKLIVYNNRLYFIADDGNGKAFWSTDGTLTDIVKVSDQLPGHYIIYNNLLYFLGFDAVNGGELWVTDGTTAGTQMAFDLNPGIASGDPTYGVVYNGLMYFRANDDVNNFELWSSDGTLAGTTKLKDIHPTGSSDPSGFVEFNNLLYFSANDDAHGYELWVTDGTSVGTTMVKDFHVGTDNTEFSELTVFNNNFYFRSSEPSTGKELYSFAYPLSIDKQVLSITQLYPNPVSDYFTINANKNISNVTIYNLNGQEVAREDFHESTVTMSIKDLSKGIYIAKVSSKDDVETMKILKF